MRKYFINFRPTHSKLDNHYCFFLGSINILNFYLFHHMVNLLPTAADALVESTTGITTGIAKNVPIIGNTAICADSVCTTGRAGINFYCSPNPVAKVFFGASCVCGVLGAASSGTALVTSFVGIPVGGWVGSFGARAFNRLGKYTLHMGNVTSGNVTNITEIGELMS